MKKVLIAICLTFSAFNAYAEEKKSTAAEKEQLERDAERAMQALQTILEKGRHFQISDEAKIRQVRVRNGVIASNFLCSTFNQI